MEELKSWYGSLPLSLRMQDAPQARLSAMGTLHLSYLTAQMTAYKAIMRTLDNNLEDNERSRACRAGADDICKAVVNFVQRLKPEHLVGITFTAQFTPNSAKPHRLLVSLVQSRVCDCKQFFDCKICQLAFVRRSRKLPAMGKRLSLVIFWCCS